MFFLKFFFGILINLDLIIIITLIGYMLFTHTTSASKKKLIKRKTRSIIGLCATFILLFPVQRLIFHQLELGTPQQTTLPPQIKGLILLGGSTNTDPSDTMTRPQYNLASGRLIEFIALAQQNPTLPILFTGNPSEAKFIQQIFTDVGIAQSRITVENESLTTAENATKSFEKVQPKPDDQWALVTSAFHMPRSYLVFKHKGWNVVPYPVDYHTPQKWTWRDFIMSTLDGLNLIAWRTAMIEIAGLVNYKLEGKTADFWPKDYAS
jgi:uncharacterized SAM-binding protein YcdF (DUF218 family)